MAIITISRGTMSGGESLAIMLSEKLKYRCISRDVIIKAADDYGVEEYKLFEAIGKSPSILQKLTFEREQYLAFIQASLCEYAKDDNLIYHGNAGHFLLKGIKHVLRFRIIADLPYRIKAAMERQKLSERDAEKYIERVDKDRKKWTKFLYGKDWTSPELYDIVINLENNNLDFVCEMVMHAIKQPRFQATPESQEAMDNLLIVSRVRAALSKTQQVRLGTLDIKSNKGNVLIIGRSRSQEITNSILQVTSTVPGVKKADVQVDVDYRSIAIE